MVNCMTQIYNWVSNNPAVSVWITIFSVISGIITIRAYSVQMKDRRKKTLCYTVSSTILLDNKVSQIEGISVNHQNTQINSLTVSEIHIWNTGNEIINGYDFYNEKSLKVMIPTGEQILSFTETKDICETSKTIISQMELNELGVTFDCYEPKQGTSFTIYHTSVLEKSVNISGKIKGGKLVDKSINFIFRDGEFILATETFKYTFSVASFLSVLLGISSISNILEISVKKKK